MVTLVMGIIAMVWSKKRWEGEGKKGKMSEGKDEEKHKKLP